MFRYIVTVGRGVPGPRSFRPDTVFRDELSDGSEVAVYVAGSQKLSGGFFRGALKGSGIFVGEAVTPGREDFPHLLASASEDSLPSLLSMVDGFYGGVLVAGSVTCFTDHIGSVPIYVSAEKAIISNSPAEVNGYPDVRQMGPAKVERLDGAGVVYWMPQYVQVSDEPSAELWDVLVDTVKTFLPHHPAIFFSGGLDSSLLAWACAMAGLQPLLLSAGVEGSKDLTDARRTASQLGLGHQETVLKRDEIVETLSRLSGYIPITSPMDAAIAVVFHLLSLRAAGDGFKVAAAGQGADELYAGYEKYVEIQRHHGYDGLARALEMDVWSLYKSGLARDTAACREGGLFLILPYLARRPLQTGLSIPAHQKLTLLDGEPARKYILRKMARRVGLDGIAGVRKRALQYGTGVEKIVRRAMG
jgi:asparagine synthase (glutamine-hydrolysing)